MARKEGSLQAQRGGPGRLPGGGRWGWFGKGTAIVPACSRGGCGAAARVPPSPRPGNAPGAGSASERPEAPRTSERAGFVAFRAAEAVRLRPRGLTGSRAQLRGRLGRWTGRVRVSEAVTGGGKAGRGEAGRPPQWTPARRRGRVPTGRDPRGGVQGAGSVVPAHPETRRRDPRRRAPTEQPSLRAAWSAGTGRPGRAEGAAGGSLLLGGWGPFQSPTPGGSRACLGAGARPPTPSEPSCAAHHPPEWTELERAGELSSGAHELGSRPQDPEAAQWLTPQALTLTPPSLTFGAQSPPR